MYNIIKSKRLEFSPNSRPTLHLWGKLLVHPATGLKHREQLKSLRKKLYIDDYMNHQFKGPSASNTNIPSLNRESKRIMGIIGQASRAPSLKNKSVPFQERLRSKQPLGQSLTLKKEKKRVVLSKFKFSNHDMTDRSRVYFTNSYREHSHSPSRIQDPDSLLLPYKLTENTSFRAKTRLTPSPLMNEEKEYNSIGVSADL